MKGTCRKTMRFYAPLFILESHACLSYLSEIQPTLATTPFGTTSFGGRTGCLSFSFFYR